MKTTLVAVFLYIFVIHAYGQQKLGTIKGKIADSTTRLTLEYANVTLLEATTGKTVNGTLANDKGAFVLANLKPGLYTLKIDFLGYELKSIASIPIRNDKFTYDAGIIYLTPQSHALTEVVVTAKAPIVRNKVDRVVYQVGNDVTLQGGVATDVLKKVPQVTVDMDGNVELQGNTGIRFLINGKPSSMFGSSLSDALASIPASQIKSVEAITSPGAKYDAQGTAGIINIILKDNKMEGLNGNVSLSGGSKLENGSINLNLHHKNLGVNLFISGNEQLRSATPSSQTRTTYDSIGRPSTGLSQHGEADLTRKAYKSGFGINWDISKTSSLSGGLSYDHLQKRLVGTTDQIQQIYDLATGGIDSASSYRQSDSRSNIHSVDWNIAYQKKFDQPGRQLDLTYDASFGSPNTSYSQYQVYQGEVNPFSGTTSMNPGHDRQQNLSIDYVHPVNAELTMEAGLKTSLQDLANMVTAQRLDPEFDHYVSDPSQSYNFAYKMNIYAAYISASFPLFHYLNVIAGTRYEYTHVRLNYGNIVVPSYGNWVPSAIISHQFSNNQLVKLAYTHRLERPDNELNPFLDLSDPYNITTGNPLLKPEISNNFELGYSKDFTGGGNMYIAFTERINSNDIKTYTAYYPTYQIGDSVYHQVSITNRRNIGTEYNTGMLITSSVPITKALNIRENLMIFNRHVVNQFDGGNKTDGINYRLNMNVSYQFQNDLVAEAFGEYKSSFNSIQGKQPQSISYTIAIKKQILHKNASLGIIATNPFNKYVNQLTTINTARYISSTFRQIPYRSFGISLSYQFGKMMIKDDKEKEKSYLNSLPSF